MKNTGTPKMSPRVAETIRLRNHTKESGALNMPNDAERLIEQDHNPSRRRDPEDRAVAHEEQVRDKMLDKTLADSFPTSDPPSSIPDPSTGEAVGAGTTEHFSKGLFAGLTPGSWVALSVDNSHILAIAATRDEAEQKAKAQGHGSMSLVEVPADSDTPLQSSGRAA
jgi:hypothetical protein